MAKKEKISIVNLERERFSNFVVDLRQTEQRLVPNVKRESKNLGRKLINQLEKIEVAVKKIKPNLLMADESCRTASIPARHSALSDRLKKLFIVKKTIRNPWLKSVKERERIFSAPPQRLAASENQNNWQPSLFFFVLVLVLIIFSFKILSRWPLGSFVGR